MSGLSKLLAGDFTGGLAGTLSDMTKDQTGPYKSFIDGVVIPNGQLFGNLVMTGELALGFVLIGSALVWLTWWSQMSARDRKRPQASGWRATSRELRGLRRRWCRYPRGGRAYFAKAVTS